MGVGAGVRRGCAATAPQAHPQAIITKRQIVGQKQVVNIAQVHLGAPTGLLRDAVDCEFVALGDDVAVPVHQVDEHMERIVIRQRRIE